MSDLMIISILNQYGQVVAPLAQSNYKGIDISERVVKMHIVKLLPPQLSIGGYEVHVTQTTDFHRNNPDTSNNSNDKTSHHSHNTTAAGGSGCDGGLVCVEECQKNGVSTNAHHHISNVSVMKSQQAITSLTPAAVTSHQNQIPSQSITVTSTTTTAQKHTAHLGSSPEQSNAHASKFLWSFMGI
jgi:hypothetical protein